MSDNWKNRAAGMMCQTCMFWVRKAKANGAQSNLGRCRRHAPSPGGWVPVFETDWCGDHRLDENRTSVQQVGQMDYVYVVTFVKLDVEQGEFYEEVAFVNERDAIKSAHDCMNSHGGYESYGKTTSSFKAIEKNKIHIVRSWSNTEWTVLLERLEVQE